MSQRSFAHASYMTTGFLSLSRSSSLSFFLSLFLSWCWMSTFACLNNIKCNQSEIFHIIKIHKKPGWPEFVLWLMKWAAHKSWIDPAFLKVETPIGTLHNAVITRPMSFSVKRTWRKVLSLIKGLKEKVPNCHIEDNPEHWEDVKIH